MQIQLVFLFFFIGCMNTYVQPGVAGSVNTALSMNVHKLAGTVKNKNYFLKHRINPERANELNDVGQSPLHAAASNNVKNNYVYFVLAGSDFNLKDNEGNNPDFYANAAIRDGRWIKKFTAMLRERMNNEGFNEQEIIESYKKEEEFGTYNDPVDFFNRCLKIYSGINSSSATTEESFDSNDSIKEDDESEAYDVGSEYDDNSDDDDDDEYDDVKTFEV